MGYSQTADVTRIRDCPNEQIVFFGFILIHFAVVFILTDHPRYT